MSHQPVRCQTDRLPAVPDGTDNIRGEESQFDQLLNAAFRDVFGLGGLAKGLAGTHQVELPVRVPNVAQHGFVDVRGLGGDDELCLDPTFAMLKRGCDLQAVFVDPGLIQIQHGGEVFGRDGHADFSGCYVDTASVRRMVIVSLIRGAMLRPSQR